MKLTISTINIIFFLILFIPPLSSAEEHLGHGTQTQGKGTESLSPGLRELLKKEMLALEKGMLAIFPAYVSGDFDEIEMIASDMKNSFILKQNITDAQKHELHTRLPQSFIDLDQKFHYLSGMLEHVAERKKPELIGFYYSELSDACMSCHSQYATHRFPAFDTKKEKHEH